MPRVSMGKHCSLQTHALMCALTRVIMHVIKRAREWSSLFMKTIPWLIGKHKTMDLECKKSWQLEKQLSAKMKEGKRLSLNDQTKVAIK